MGKKPAVTETVPFNDENRAWKRPQHVAHILDVRVKGEEVGCLFFGGYFCTPRMHVRMASLSRRELTQRK